MQFSEIKGDCRFNGTLATDRTGILYDSRFRQRFASRAAAIGQGDRTVEANDGAARDRPNDPSADGPVAEKHGLSEGRLHVLFSSCPPPDISFHLASCRSARRHAAQHHRLIDHLERDGLVERVDDPDDRRQTYARLTPAGGKRLEGMRARDWEWQLRITAGLSIEELEVLRHACLRLIENMNGASASQRESA